MMLQYVGLSSSDSPPGRLNTSSTAASDGKSGSSYAIVKLPVACSRACATRNTGGHGSVLVAALPKRTVPGWVGASSPTTTRWWRQLQFGAGRRGRANSQVHRGKEWHGQGRMRGRPAVLIRPRPFRR
jgi:hypothetical protein